MLQQNQITSSNGPEIFLKFVNDSTSTVQIDWVSYEGELTNYITLQAGEESD